MVAGYRVPTNLELAERAEAIVVAEVSGSRPSAASDRLWEGAVIATPVATLKGQFTRAAIEIPGAQIGKIGKDVWPSAPRELRQPNTGALIGGCVRYSFAMGMKLVLFMHRDKDGNLVPFRSAFSRDAEDVQNLDALRVKAIREYAAISMLPKAARRTALDARLRELRAQSGDADAQAIADDLAIERKGKRQPPFD